MAVKKPSLLSRFQEHDYWGNLWCLIKNMGKLVTEEHLWVLYFPMEVGFINNLIVMLSILNK